MKRQKTTTEMPLWATMDAQTVDGNVFDIVVVGGGHAGCEAALAASRMDCRTLLITTRLNKIGCMPCNPSVGGLAKSHLVAEIDALGGEMGRNADFTGLQFRTLNTSRGPAVRATRIQCDKVLYSMRMLATVLSTENLTVIEDECVGILWHGDVATGVKTRIHGEIEAKAVVVTTGTALKGVIFIGHEALQSGGDGRPGSAPLSESLKEMGFELRRLKTGTPPRLHVDSIDFSRLPCQPSEDPPPFFSEAARRWGQDAEGAACATWHTQGEEDASEGEDGECATWHKARELLWSVRLPNDEAFLAPVGGDAGGGRITQRHRDTEGDGEKRGDVDGGEGVTQRHRDTEEDTGEGREKDDKDDGGEGVTQRHRDTEGNTGGGRETSDGEGEGWGTQRHRDTEGNNSIDAICTRLAGLMRCADTYIRENKRHRFKTPGRQRPLRRNDLRGGGTILSILRGQGGQVSIAHRASCRIGARIAVLPVCLSQRPFKQSPSRRAGGDDSFRGGARTCPVPPIRIRN